ncbi:MAG: hypothetical protein AN484_24540 [Aphanizomenon flos-aquae WA102]|uniref:Replication-associated protein ORF2/G2P domain-containing protein n=1 Tax=Aphanizomenon flos-aquae WA102 TaxID=1710896 RepID=A0A1B7WLW7_APHFL|nr:MAG: hypothetical protein AN484_24540 [Aphanizomenon flos-aquae WA102]
MRRRTSGWSFRLVKEGDRSKNALFVTLTYNDEHIKRSKNNYKNLDKKDLQKFFKRLRKLTNEKIKYYAVGEYGTQNMRPHYHIILFNSSSEIIQRAWNLDNKVIGNIYIGSVTEASIGYTLKYMCKGGKIPQHKNDDRQKEFSVMSKGLGANYLTEQMINWHKADLTKRMYVPMKDNKKIAMPRYYKDKIYSEKEKQKVAISIKEIAEKQVNEEMLELGDAYNAIMAERHVFAFQKMYKHAELGRNKI